MMKTDNSLPLSQYLLQQSCNFRCGVILPYQRVPNTFCDIENVYNYSIPEDAAFSSWQTASGALGFDKNQAIRGTIGEALERYSSAIYRFPLKKHHEIPSERIVEFGEFSLFSAGQYGNPQFPWRRPALDELSFGKVYSLYSNQEYWVPQELIGLGSRNNSSVVPSTSTGLAAHTDRYTALISALLEVLERDALTAYWLHSLGGREIELTPEYTQEVLRKKGRVYCFDITQEWNPFPVVMVCGHLPENNKKRISMGAACRPAYHEAMEKAYLEWMQGCMFAGYYDRFHKDLLLEKPEQATDFDLHAVYYTKNPLQWDEVPIIKQRTQHTYAETCPPFSQSENEDGDEGMSKNKLEYLLKALHQEKIRLFYKDISTVDAQETGVYVVRVLSPDLALLHGDENIPFLGGRTGDALWRYPDIKPGKFPNIYPHPLG
jgi:ribosomal protein S12 methylthiotransferase accessory factor